MFFDTTATPTEAATSNCFVAERFVIPTPTEEAMSNYFGESFLIVIINYNYFCLEQMEILKKRVERIEQEANTEKACIENQSQSQARISSDKTLSKRRGNVDAEWNMNRETFFTAIIKHKALLTSEIFSCSKIAISHLAVRCSTCRENLCPKCDWAFHFTRPFHYRELFEEILSRPLPSECVQSNGHV